LLELPLNESREWKNSLHGEKLQTAEAALEQIIKSLDRLIRYINI
jgi:hypothetical protein